MFSALYHVGKKFSLDFHQSSARESKCKRAIMFRFISYNDNFHNFLTIHSTYHTYKLSAGLSYLRCLLLGPKIPQKKHVQFSPQEEGTKNMKHTLKITKNVKKTTKT